MNSQLKDYVDELLDENYENLGEIKQLSEDFFRDKVQEDIDSEIPKEVNEWLFINNLLASRDPKKPLTAVERALIERNFYGTPNKYFWKEIETSLISEKLKKFKEFVIIEFDLGNLNEEISGWVDWAIKEDVDWDDYSIENKLEDFKLSINITNYESSPEPDLSVFMIGDKKYKDKINKAMKILK